MPRKYVKIDEYGKEILELKREGKTNREIAQKLGVDRKCIRNWVFRFNRQQRKLAAGIKLRPKGRPQKDAQPRDIVAEQAYGINRLKMENTIHLAMKSVKTESRRELHLHSDQGFQYTSQAYFNLTKNTAFCRLCQGVETAMTMRWLKTFSESSKQSASTDTSRKLLRKPTRRSMITFTSTTTNASN